MTFKFRWLCELLRELDANRVKKAAAASKSVNPDTRTIVAWFNKHNLAIVRHGDAAVAFLSCLFPERRADRVYSMQETRISKIIGRSLLLGVCRKLELDRWSEQDGADFAQCVEAVMAQAENPVPQPAHDVTLEELDQALDQIAAKVAFSSPGLRQRVVPSDAYEALHPILCRLQSWEAKWLIRMLLKTYSPVVIPESMVMQQFHFLLPELLALQNSFVAVAKVLAGAHIRLLPPRPTREYVDALKLGVVNELTPQIGIMVGRPPYHKARSIKHCCQLAGRKRMSLERKYDGEYCQIHIDMSKGRDYIKIFSKSGKNSTNDRIRLHGTLKDCLKIGTNDCRIHHHCILEGELLVWNDHSGEIQPFHKIRKHVQRSGRWLGNKADSPASLAEHLMVIFYDILVVDATVCMKEPHSKRRQRLESVIHPIPGFAELGTREIVDFSSRKAPNQLRRAFANGITQRWEGFVLKGNDDSYFSFNHGNRCIKLKKDYICGLGDTADFAIVGGRRDPKVERELGIGRLHWTHFYVGCLENKEEVKRFDAKPKYRIVDTLSHHNISKDDILFLGEHGQFVRLPYAESGAELDVKVDQPSMLRPTELFKQAFIVELMGAGFDKPADASYFTLRFPRVIKIQADRAARDAVSFDDLQELARCSKEAPADSDSQEDRRWIEKLLIAEGRDAHLIDESVSTVTNRSPDSVRTASANATPVGPSKAIPPSLVRIDSDELLPEEQEYRKRLESHSIRASQLQDSSLPHGLKRKDPSLEVTTEANTSSKRIKASSTINTKPSKEKSLVLQNPWSTPSCIGRVRSIYQTTPKPTLGRLQRTPPWCNWQDQEGVQCESNAQKPTDVHHTKVCASPVAAVQLRQNFTPFPNSGEPLSEITNASDGRTKRTPEFGLQKSMDGARERGSLVLGSPLSIRKKSQAGRTKELYSRSNKAMFLPTPPTSSAEQEKRGSTGKGDLWKQRDFSLASCQEQAAVLKQHECMPMLLETITHQSAITSRKISEVIPFSSPTQPLLLSKSLEAASGPRNTQLSAFLQKSAKSFTYSSDYFLSALASSSSATGQPASRGKSTGIVLINTTRPDVVATDMLSIAGAIAKLLREDDWLKNGGIVLFFDWSILTVLEVVELMEVELQKRFGGCLAWPGEALGSTDAGKGRRVRAIWNWGDAFANF